MIIHWVGIGDVKSAGNGEHLGTILGSCVATVLWHPQQKFAVMNHILLPGQALPRTGLADGRYAVDSWRMMLNRLARQGISVRECEAHVAGGANVLANCNEFAIGTRNTEFMLGLLEAANIHVRSLNVGGNGHRTVRFDPDKGEFKVTYSPAPNVFAPSLSARAA